jgi:hypothetical protein
MKQESLTAPVPEKVALNVRLQQELLCSGEYFGGNWKVMTMKPDSLGF